MEQHKRPRPVDRSASLRSAPPRTAHPLLALQTQVGNRGVQRLVDRAQKSGGAQGSTTGNGPVKAGAMPRPDAPAPVDGTTKTASAPAGTAGGSPGQGATPLVSARFAGDPALQACRQGSRYVRMGSSGDPVTKIQQALIDLGYPLSRYGADGQFGTETRVAVVAYQSDSGLSADGIIGRDSIGALDADLVTEPPSTTPGTATPGTATPGTPTPANLHHQRLIPIVAPDPHDPSQRTWLAINADTGGVAFNIGPESGGSDANSLPLGTELPMQEMYLVDTADGGVLGFIGAEHAEEAYQAALREQDLGALPADYPDMEPPPPNLHLEIIEPTVQLVPLDDTVTRMWVAIDTATGEVSFNLGDEYDGQHAASLPVGTTAPRYHLWTVDTADGGVIGSVGAENAAQMWDTARRQADNPEPPTTQPGTSSVRFVPTGGLIRSGSRLEEVQTCLRQLGYDPGPIDGIKGPLTTAAVTAFQRDRGLVPDGIIGPLTQAALAEATS